MTSHTTPSTIPGVQMYAFNIVKGAAFQPASGATEVPWCAMHVVNNSYNEQVFAAARKLTDSGPVELETFTFHYTDIVWLVGLVVNTNEFDDCNFGQVFSRRADTPPEQQVELTTSGSTASWDELTTPSQVRDE